jgi:hypothetical protein
VNSDNIPKALAAQAQAMPANPASSQVASLQVSIQRNMLITGQRLIKTFDALTTLKPEDEGELGFFADQLTRHFAADIKALRQQITNTLQLADHMVKGSL